MLGTVLERWPPTMLRAIVVVLPVRARFVGLQCVGEPIYEQGKIPLCHFRVRLAHSFHKVPSLRLAVDVSICVRVLRMHLTPTQVFPWPSEEVPDEPSMRQGCTQ